MQSAGPASSGMDHDSGADERQHRHQLQQPQGGNIGQGGQSSAGDTPGSRISQPHEQHSFGNESWGDMTTYSQTAMSDYGNFDYMHHGLPTHGSLNRMPPPPTPQPIQPQLHHHHQTQQHGQHNQHHQPQTHPQLPMLIMPQHQTWPSMLTNPGSYSAPPLTTTAHTGLPSSIPTPSSATKGRVSGAGGSHPRRTLSDDERRRMCQYAQDHPTVKQTEIGNMFGVERSTVSKVLRNKEKYLSPEDRSSSPIKRSKGKFPDIERALASWARKAQQQGADLTDAKILEKAKHFAVGVGDNQENHMKNVSSSWLEKFKQKHGIGSKGRLLRRASETNIIDSAKTSASPSLAPLQASGISPASPTGGSGPSPLSGSRSDDDIKDSMPHFMDYESGNYKHTNSQSTNSLNSAFTDTGASSFSGDTMSPGGPFTFSPDPNVGGFPPAQGGPGFQRPRSQTFPNLNLEYLHQQGDSESLTPRYQASATAASDLDSPEHEINAPPFGINAAMSSPQSLHTSSAIHTPSMTRPTITPAAAAAAASGSATPSPTSPTQEDARRAADTLLSFIQSLGNGAQLFDQNDFQTVLKLTEKLKIHHGHTQQGGVGSGRVASGGHSGGSGLGLGIGLGGLSRIPEGDSEGGNGGSVGDTSVKTEVTMAG